MSEGMRPNVGWGVRPPGWVEVEENPEVELLDEDAESPEVVIQQDEWRAFNRSEGVPEAEQPALPSEESDSEDEEPRAKRAREERESRNRRKKDRRERRERRREHKYAEAGDASESSASISSIVRSLPQLEDLPREEMLLQWPMWRDMLMTALELQSPTGREWTEKEKHLVLMLKGGRHVREIASFTAPIAGEISRDEAGDEPKFSNLVKRINAALKPSDPMMEITVLRSMCQKSDESVREFLERARRQASLCGYATAEERDRELMMMLKQNATDAIAISQHSLLNLSLEQMEAAAINLEAIRRRQERQQAPRVEAEEDIHAVMGKVEGWGKRNQPGPSGHQQNSAKPPYQGRGDCYRCGRPGGHEPGWKCRAESMPCFKCGRNGHLAAMCNGGGGDQGGRRGGTRGNNNTRESREMQGSGGASRSTPKPAASVNKVSASDPANTSTGWSDD